MTKKQLILIQITTLTAVIDSLKKNCDIDINTTYYGSIITLEIGPTVTHTLYTDNHSLQWRCTTHSSISKHGRIDKLWIGVDKIRKQSL